MKGDVVAFVDGDGTLVGHQGEHREAHAVVRGEEAFAEKLLQFGIIVSGVLDPCHRRSSWVRIKQVRAICARQLPTPGAKTPHFAPGTRVFASPGAKQGLSAHCGRKTFICFMLSIGIAPQVVMKFTGHADYKSMKPYIDIAEKAKTDAMDAMDKALNG